MKETNNLINISSALSIVSGVVLTYTMLEKGTMEFDINFIFYLLGQFTWLFGLLTLLRENRSKK